MRRVSLPYRDFYFPLNVFMHILTHEEGDVRYLHYGFFEGPEESIAEAQDRSTAMLFDRLPPAPATVLDVGTGLGTTLSRLLNEGYRAEGITPDERQIAVVRDRFGADFPIAAVRLEDFSSARRFDAIVFQESAQYIEPNALFAKCAEILAADGRIIVLDEFATDPVDGGLHLRSKFLEAAEGNGFRLGEEVDVSRLAAPTIRYFMARLERFRERLIADLGVTTEQVDHLIESGDVYTARYASAIYVYRVMRFGKALQ